MSGRRRRVVATVHLRFSRRLLSPTRSGRFVASRLTGSSSTSMSASASQQSLWSKRGGVGAGAWTPTGTAVRTSSSCRRPGAVRAPLPWSAPLFTKTLRAGVGQLATTRSPANRRTGWRSWSAMPSYGPCSSCGREPPAPSPRSCRVVPVAGSSLRRGTRPS
jgi:hypothetical protein